MSFSPKEIGLGVLLLLLTVGLTRFFTPEKVKYQTAEQEHKLDSLTTLTHTLRIDRSQLEDSLENTSEAFQEYVENNEDKLATYNKMIGKLNLKVDSLQEEASVSLGDLQLNMASGPMFRDTTLQKISTFGNGLIQATATGGIRNDSLFLESPSITQLRSVRIHQAQFIEDGQFRTITTSKDFEDLEVVSVTTREEEGRRFPWLEVTAVASFILGYAL